MLTDVAIGAWTSSMALDLLPNRRGADASRTLVGLGCVAAVPTAVSGWSDWADLDDDVRRIGVAHALANLTATSLYSASWLARRQGAVRTGIALGWLGAGVATVGGYLGGHLTYAKASGVDPTVGDRLPHRWTEVVQEAQLASGAPLRVFVGRVPVVLVRDEDGIYALHDRCTHRRGPLHQGTVVDGCIECPWHGSRFRLADGSIVRGPATFAQPSLRTRVRDGSVEVRGD